MADENKGIDVSGQDRRKRSVPHPRNSLVEAERFGKQAFIMGSRNVDQDRLATELGYSGVRNGAYKRVRAATNHFGLVEYSGDDWISVSQAWIDAFHSEDADRLAEVRAHAVRQPEMYQRLFAEYEGKMLPNPERLGRELHLNTEYGITPDAAPLAAEVFLESVRHANLVHDGYLRSPVDRDDASEAEGELPMSDGPRNQQDDRDRPPGTDLRSNAQDVDRIEIRLRGGRKAFLLIPAPGILTPEDKNRIKGHVDLVLEEAE